MLSYTNAFIDLLMQKHNGRLGSLSPEMCEIHYLPNEAYRQ